MRRPPPRPLPLTINEKNAPKALYPDEKKTTFPDFVPV